MEEIDLAYMEEHFDEVMDGVENGKSFLLRTPDGAGVVILPEKNPVIQEMEKQNLIKKFK
jgi:hypothetical protein